LISCGIHVVGAGIQIFPPGPVVFERDELVEVGTAVDDPLVVHPYPTGAQLQVFKVSGGTLEPARQLDT